MLFDRAARIQIRSFLIAAIVSIVAALAGAGPFALVAGTIVAMLTTSVLVSAAVRWRPSLPDVVAFPGLFSYGRYAMVNSALNMLNGRLDNLLVASRLGIHDVGLYNRAYSLARIPTDQLGESVFPLIFSALSRIQDDARHSRELCATAIFLIAALSAPALVFLVLCGPAVVRLLYGEAWSGSGVPLQVMAVAGMFVSISVALRGLINAQGLLPQLLKVHLINLVVIACVVLALAPFGLTAVAVGITVREAVNVWLMARILRATQVAFSVRELARIVAPVGIASVGGAAAGLALAAGLEPGGDSWLREAWRLSQIGAVAVAGYAATFALTAWMWKSHATAQAARGVAMRFLRGLGNSARRRGGESCVASGQER
jgi:PST family polysaccharide transporter